jgi:hypothetical protein
MAHAIAQAPATRLVTMAFGARHFSALYPLGGIFFVIDL